MLIKRFFKTKEEVEVTFEMPKAEWKTAQVAGEFNQWQPEPMKLNRKTGMFRYKTRVPKEAAIQFRYLFDDQHWDNDPIADAYTPNGLGSDNSVVSTQTS